MFRIIFAKDPKDYFEQVVNKTARVLNFNYVEGHYNQSTKLGSRGPDVVVYIDPDVVQRYSDYGPQGPMVLESDDNLVEISARCLLIIKTLQEYGLRAPYTREFYTDALKHLNNVCRILIDKTNADLNGLTTAKLPVLLPVKDHSLKSNYSLTIDMVKTMVMRGLVQTGWMDTFIINHTVSELSKFMGQFMDHEATRDLTKIEEFLSSYRKV